MMTEQILSLVRAMGGPTGQDEVLAPMAQAAQRELTGRLKPGLTPGDCGSAFPVACAMVVLALGDTEGEGVTSFSAGDLTIRRRGGLAGQRFRSALALLAPYLAQTDFAFQGVGG